MSVTKLLRGIPKVDLFLKHKEWDRLVSFYSETMAKDALRRMLDRLRFSIKEGSIDEIPSMEELIRETERVIIETMSPGLKRVINCTGIIIHTNLGRSLLPRSAIDGLIEAASSYINLEYDLTTGRRGDRYVHCTEILKRLTGAEAALVVNNNAAAVYLVLNSLAEGKEVVVSRGELIEIGGSFRIPDVMKKSGAILKEVGTTNRTYIEDYEKAIDENTGLLMKAHTSNYRIRGFAQDITTEELALLGKRYDLPSYYDAGSGLMVQLDSIGVDDEPCIVDEVNKGLDIVSFSGDKLLGGPQAGIIIGKSAYIERLKKNPMTRAFRIDKFTLAALERILLIYLEKGRALKDVPTLRMLYEKKETIARRARRMFKKLKAILPGLDVVAKEVFSEVGGGSLPDISIPSFGLSIRPAIMGVKGLERELRKQPVPIICRIERDRLIIDLRTVAPEDDTYIISSLETILKQERGQTL